MIESGATVESLQMSDVSVINRTPGAIHVLTNKGTIGCLAMTDVFAKADGNPARGAVVCSTGRIGQHSLQHVFTVNVAPGIAK